MSNSLNISACSMTRSPGTAQNRNLCGPSQSRLTPRAKQDMQPKSALVPSVPSGTQPFRPAVYSRSCKLPAAISHSSSMPERPIAGSVSRITYKEGEFVELGEVVSAHGVKGEVKVAITTDSPKLRFGKTGTMLYLKQPAAKGLLSLSQADESALIELTTGGFKVQMAGDGKEIWILKFAEIHDRTIAEKLRHHVIVLPCAHREELRDPDEFYAQDLIGSHVFGQADGLYVGQVVELFSGFGTTETLQLKLRLTKEDMAKARVRTCMIPFTKAMVPLVDVKAKRILVSLPEGLLDLCSTKKTKAMDEERKALKLREISSLEEVERSRRVLEPIAAPTEASMGEQAQSEEANEEDGEEDVLAPEDDEVKRKPAPARRSRFRRPSPRKALKLTPS